MRDRVKSALEQIAEETGSAILKEVAEVLASRPQYAVLSENGEVMPCDMMSWARNLRGKQRVIAQEDLAGGHWISTVFLGLNHGYDPFGPNLWFETMIFGPATGERCPFTERVMEHGESIYCERHTTLKEALEGHQRAKEWLDERIQDQRQALRLR